jgi:hypothetical protein
MQYLLHCVCTGRARKQFHFPTNLLTLLKESYAQNSQLSRLQSAFLFQLSRTQITPPAPLSHFACRAKISQLCNFLDHISGESEQNQPKCCILSITHAPTLALTLSAARGFHNTLCMASSLGARRRRKQQRGMIHGHYCRRYYFNALVSHL